MDQNSGEKSSILRLRKRLYSRGAKFSRRGRRVLRRGGEDAAAPEEWQKEYHPPRQQREKRSYLSIFLIASLIFFALSIGVSALFFLGGSDVSTKNIDIDIEGPIAIDGGDTLSLSLSITNRNSVALEAADLLIEYPEGTRSAADQSVPLPRSRESIGTIAPGERVERSIRAVLFGKEGSPAVINFSLEYRVPDSNAIFVAEESYRLILSSSPLSLSINVLREVTSGQELVFVADVSSNSSSVIKNVLLAVEYPFGFTFKEATPDPSFVLSVWELGDIEPEGKRTVTIRGTMEGEDGDERVFRFASGIQSERDEKEIATAFITSLESVAIKKPFVSVNLALGGDTDDPHVVSRGEKIRADITWLNNLPVTITDSEIEVRLRGSSLDRNSVSADRGFYRSLDNTIIWSKETAPDLASLSPGETGSASFSFATLPLSAGTVLPNSDLILEVDVRGRRLSDQNVPEEIQSSVVRTIQLATDLLVTSRALHFSGPFINSGPMPPKADSETTYTVVWTVQNSANAVANAQVVAALPSFVRWMNVVSPKDAQVAFNPVGGQITWTIGDMAGAGSAASATRELAFQVALTPSLSHVGATPTLVNEQRTTALDRFTQTRVETVTRPLTTRLSTDPGFSLGQERVVE